MWYDWGGSQQPDSCQCCCEFTHSGSGSIGHHVQSQTMASANQSKTPNDEQSFNRTASNGAKTMDTGSATIGAMQIETNDLKPAFPPTSPPIPYYPLFGATTGSNRIQPKYTIDTPVKHVQCYFWAIFETQHTKPSRGIASHGHQFDRSAEIWPLHITITPTP